MTRDIFGAAERFSATRKEALEPPSSAKLRDSHAEVLCKNWSRLVPPMLVVSMLTASGGGGGAPAPTPAPNGRPIVVAPITQVDPAPTPITPSDPLPAPITVEPSSFRDLLATGIYDLQLQTLDANNTSFSPYVAKHTLVSTSESVSGIRSTAVTRLLSSTIQSKINSV